MFKGLQTGFPSPFENVRPLKSGLQCFDSISQKHFTCESPGNLMVLIIIF